MEEIFDFYLSLNEQDALGNLRKCWQIDRVKDNCRDDYMLIRIDPPTSGQDYGLGGNDIDTLIIATRHAGYSLFPITSWPVFVYVLRILDKTVISSKILNAKQVKMIAWGVLYRSLEDVRKVIKI